MGTDYHTHLMYNAAKSVNLHVENYNGTLLCPDKNHSVLGQVGIRALRTGALPEFNPLKFDDQAFRLQALLHILVANDGKELHTIRTVDDDVYPIFELVYPTPTDPIELFNLIRYAITTHAAHIGAPDEYATPG